MITTHRSDFTTPFMDRRCTCSALKTYLRSSSCVTRITTLPIIRNIMTMVMIFLIIGSVVILVTQDELLKYVFRALHVHRRSMKGVVKSLRWVVIIPLFYFTIAFI